MKRIYIPFLIALFISCVPEEASEEWPVAGGSVQRTQYSGLSQIDTTNVAGLEVLWTYQTHDAGDRSQIQCNPVVIDGTLYGTSPKLKLFALDALTGNEKWIFDPLEMISGETGGGLNTNRGVTHWSDGKISRILYVVGPKLISVDADTGLPDTDFGETGMVDLREGLDRDVASLYVTATSPGVVYGDLLILGSRVSEALPAAPGHIRAYDIRSGQLVWVFHTIPHPGEAGFETWEDSLAYLRTGGANSWSGLSLDPDRGWVYASTGSAAFDFYGGDRKGDNLFANSILALDASSGKLQWYYQVIHHDVWDRDLPAPPVLAELEVNGEVREVAIQATKTGYLFILDRDTGKPVYPVDEVTVPTESGLKGEALSRTQPVPQFPEPFMRHSLSWNKLREVLPDSSNADLEARLEKYKYGEMFTPPSEEGTIFFPGLDGGAEWGGSSFDADEQVLFINANEVPWLITNVKKTGDPEAIESGKAIYSQFCMSCHGPNLEGAGNYPGLSDAGNRLSGSYIRQLLESGKGMMPAFSFLSDEQKEAITDYVINYEPGSGESDDTDDALFRGYGITGYHKLQTVEGLPAIDPPWGTMNAVDLITGKIKWRVPLGEHPLMENMGTGTENYGGPVATDGGLVFIAATPDQKFRAFQKSDGKLLWETKLPAAGFSTPAVYRAGGRQIIVQACGGGKLGSPSGDFYVAFSLPD